MKKTDIVLAGFSGYGSFYTDFLFENPYNMEYNFAGVADPFLSDDCKTLLNEKNIPFYDSLEEFYAAGSADLAIISAPIHFHKDLCETALKNGSTVLCEKPTTARLSELYEMHEFEKKYGKDIFIGFQWSFATPILKLKKDLISGKFGKILSAKAIVLWPRNLSYYGRTTGWAGKIKTKDGLYVHDSVASNATAHYLNNLLFLLGERMETAAKIEVIDAKCYKANDIESFDTCIINAKTAKEEQVLFIASHAVEKSKEPLLEIKCEKAVINCDFAKDDGMLTAVYNDGGMENYGEVSTLRQQHEKLISVINWLQGSENSTKPVSTVMTTESFTQIIDYVFENVEFKKLDDIRFEDDKDRFYGYGLFDKLVDTYNKQ